MDPISKAWWIGISGEEYSAWMVGFNPVGEGLALKLNRGIICEGHVQLFTAHCTNTPEPEDVEFIVNEYKDEWQGAVDNFVAFMRAYPRTACTSSDFKQDKWESRDHIGSIFCWDLIREIAKRSEDHFCERFFKKDVCTNCNGADIDCPCKVTHVPS
ncbi:hypothetical protein LCGC14_1085590 [marine sediment metagenome]|uniref:Uncharacterized protein n=1 Tax=marine sediment metagenome TaxID=412755 RepID=A0A0F9QJV6_9ZZZZ